MIYRLLILLSLAFFITLVGCAKSESTQDTQASASAVSPAPPPQEKKWYQGGTLHRAGALDWQNATYDNKMATCADFFAALYQDKKLKQSILSSIKSTDDMVPYVEKLVADMDTALSKEHDPKKNNMMYANQRVSEIAAMLMVLNGWTKPN